DGVNYLVPLNARLSASNEARFECLDANRVLAKMETAASGVNIVILDACRNNPLARSWRSADAGLAPMNAPSGSIMAFATAPGSVAADGTGRNGVFTGALLKHLATPGIDIENAFKRVAADVQTT